MGEHRIHLDWTGGEAPFTYESYSRNHQIRFKDGVMLTVSAAAPYRGDPAHADPEDLLVASLSSCHMLSFLAICAKKRLTVESYRDDAVGFLENDGGKYWVTRVILRPEVRFAVAPDAETLAHVHHKAHETCFIANSVKTDVRVEPVP
ncbi:MAG: osmotically inducible protein OsmC [Alphaproteobacteria bacterium 64-11]|nr:OsmC family protein [Alphaproteobacteria bacterium]OJU08631.1 MAG: osmotically inducible protein OsmC [Alphaproteobacteria bacterium 64-11]